MEKREVYKYTNFLYDKHNKNHVKTEVTMTKAKKKKSSVMDAVERASQETAEEFENDDELFDTDTSIGYQHSKRKTDEEIAIDEMLVGLDTAQGCYLKLNKEIAPNEWQFKKRIDHFKHWADMEFQIVSIVRSETADEIKRSGRISRWGSGRYMISFFNDSGLRAEKRKPVFFNIDAQEPDNIPVVSPDTSIIRDILDKQNAIDPNDVLKLSIDSMQKGMEIAANKDAKRESGEQSALGIMMQSMQQQTTLMVGLITAMMSNKPNAPDGASQFSNMIEILKTTGMINPPKQEKNLVDQVKEMQALGLIKPVGDDDALKSIEKVKMFMGLASDFAHVSAGERPSIVEKLIDILGPKVPDMLTNLTKTVGTVAEIQKTKVAMRTPVPPKIPYSQDNHSQDSQFENISDEYEDTSLDPGFDDSQRLSAQPQGYSQPVRTQEEEQAMQIKKFADTLYHYVSTRDYSKFNEITQVLGQFLGGEQEVINKIKNGNLTTSTIVNYILMFDREHYKDTGNKNLLIDYVNRYLGALKTVNQPQPQPHNAVIVTCESCGQEHEFENKDMFLEEQKEHDGKVICGMSGCETELTLPE